MQDRWPPVTHNPQQAVIEVWIYEISSLRNFVSLAILIGGLSAMVPVRANEVVLLGSRSMIAGLMAGAMTACIMGVLEAVAGN